MSSDLPLCRKHEVEIRSLPTSTVRILWRRADQGQKYGPARWTLDQTRPITEGRWSPNLATMTCAISASVGRPPGTTCSGACACTTALEQRRQAYLGRRVTSTRSWAGTTSSRSETSSPILAISPQPQGQSVLLGSMTRSIRGRCFGRWPRLRFGVPLSVEPCPFSARRAFCCAASSTPCASSTSSSGRLNCSGSSFSDFRPNFSRRNSLTSLSSRFRVSTASASAASVLGQGGPSVAHSHWPERCRSWLRSSTRAGSPPPVNHRRVTLPQLWRFGKTLNRQNPATPSALSGFWRCSMDQEFPETPYPASSGRRTRSGRTSRQSRPSNSAENCAGDIVITPSCALGQTNFAPSKRLWTSTMPV